MSFVMARIFAQLSRKDSVAVGSPCTIIFHRNEDSVYRYSFYVTNAYQFAWRNFWDDCLDRATIVKPLEVDEE